MRLIPAVALCVAIAATTSGFAADKELTGSFKKQAGDIDLKIIFKKDGKLDYHVKFGESSCTLKCKYTLKDGVYKCEITEFEKKGDIPVDRKKGQVFSMKVEVKGEKIKVSNFEGDEIDENAKNAVEGDYEKATD